ncbi:CLUMA_CG016612, isoform A [Clunio marinus]|uniref:CLUMA_CG016612, isoform A n=1 Tax=Clunio marinus TaxID=568069 RepID=A0A1J1ISI2_9DIPT|nr:CLUMA_CG016612, isoform A [Clunio marinus]
MHVLENDTDKGRKITHHIYRELQLKLDKRLFQFASSRACFENDREIWNDFYELNISFMGFMPLFLIEACGRRLNFQANKPTKFLLRPTDFLSFDVYLNVFRFMSLSSCSVKIHKAS